jgi:predicted chitinase
LTANEFDVLYNTTRATFLRAVLNHGIDSSGLCQNCQAKAAFLTIAATMTNNFQSDEMTANDTDLAADDSKYGNIQAGDGSRFRRRGFFGLRGRTMYQILQALVPQLSALSNPELAANTTNAFRIAALLWNNSDILNGKSSIEFDALNVSSAATEDG